MNLQDKSGLFVHLFVECPELLGREETGIWVSFDPRYDDKDADALETEVEEWLTSKIDEETATSPWKVTLLVHFPIDIDHLLPLPIGDVMDIYELTNEYPDEAVELFFKSYSDASCGDFTNSYEGEYQSEEEFADHLNEESGFNAMLKEYGKTTNSIDLDYEAKELEHDYDFFEGKSKIYVFNNH